MLLFNNDDPLYCNTKNTSYFLTCRR